MARTSDHLTALLPLATAGHPFGTRLLVRLLPALSEHFARLPAESALHEALRAVPTVREALVWARFPVLSTAPGAAGGTVVRIGDLRYHLKGEPTLEFVLELGPSLAVEEARLERGGSARELLERWRK